MVSIIRRMRALRTKLLNIRLGPGAATLPNDVKRLHLDFAARMYDGHMGARKFWRECLPRLKYHNPAVSMTVNRTADQTSGSTMTVFFAPSVDPNSPAENTESSVNERAQVIDMKYKHWTEILDKLIKVTNAVEVKPTEGEILELRQLEEERIKSEEDRTRTAAVRAQILREKELMAQAKASIAGSEATA